MSSLLQAWRSAAPKSITSPYMTSEFNRDSNRWDAMPVGSRPIDTLVTKLEQSGVSGQQVEDATCQFCGELHLDEQGNSTWGLDMGYRACANPYCGSI